MLEKTIKLMVCGGMLTLVACSAQATEDNRGEFVRVAQSSALDTDFTVAAEQTVNAVVCIKSYVTPRQSSGYNSPFGGGFDPFEFFFGPQQRQPQQQQRRQQNQSESELVQSGLGSGVIISEDGYIVTNNHVIDSAEKIEVLLNDNNTYEADVVGTDEATDLALIKIDAKDLHAITFGDSDAVKVGEWVLAVGNPFGFNSTVTAGIVSAKARSLGTNGKSMGLESFIQTDAALNPGNSGGPLVNMYGQVIGITSSKYVGTGYEGIGFAISIDEALPIIKQLVSYGYVTDRAKLGIEYTFISESSAYMYGLKSGLYVKTIDQDCAVAKSELKVYDIITEIDGVEMNTTEAVSDIMAGKKPGDTIEVSVYRFASNALGGRLGTTKGETLTFEIILSEDKGELN